MIFSKSRQRNGIFDFLKNLRVVTWITIVNVVVFIVAIVLVMISDKYISYFALMPSNILAGKYLWTLVLHMFAHFYFWHLFVNMFVLFSLGSLCEKIIGRKRFIWFYLAGGLFAGIQCVILYGFFGYGFGERIFGGPDVFMVGASGAIFAIAGLYVMLLPRIRFSIIFLPFFSLPAYVMVPAALFIMWGLSVAFNWPIGNVAHFGGFLTGVGYGAYLRFKYKNKVERLQRFFDR